MCVAHQSLKNLKFLCIYIYFLGHRVRTVYAFGMVVLEILGTYEKDSGTYTCVATNKWGRDEISVDLKCTDLGKGQPPRFTTQIKVNGKKMYTIK